MIADSLTDLELSQLEKKIEMSERERYPTTLLPTRTLRQLFDIFKKNAGFYRMTSSEGIAIDKKDRAIRSLEKLRGEYNDLQNKYDLLMRDFTAINKIQ